MTERNLYEVTGDIKDINTLLVNREEWNRRAQPAQAVPVLTDAEIHAADPIPQNRFDQERVEFARRVEQAVRAKMGAVPMTDGQALDSISRAKGIGGVIRTDGQLFALVREVERHHGIVGKEGGNV